MIRAKDVDDSQEFEMKDTSGRTHLQVAAPRPSSDDGGDGPGTARAGPIQNFSRKSENFS